MKPLSIQAKLLIGIVVACGLAILGNGMMHWGPVSGYVRFAAYLCVASVAARFKVTLPRMTSSMSVNLPFILLAVMELSLGEALVVAAVSTLVQSVHPDSKKRNVVQLAFNVAVLVISAQLTWLAFHAGVKNAALALVAAAATILLANTVPVAAIIALTEEAGIAQTWGRILQLTFPYYLLAAGVSSLVRLANVAIGWEMPILILPAMFFVYRSYATYFRQMVENQAMPENRAMAAKAGAY